MKNSLKKLKILKINSIKIMKINNLKILKEAYLIET